MSIKSRSNNNLKINNSDISKSSPLEVELYNSNNRPTSKQKIFQLKEELKQKKSEYLNSTVNNSKNLNSKDNNKNLIENMDIIASIDKIKILKDGYEASRDKAAEVMKSDELSVYLQVIKIIYLNLISS